MRVESVFGSIGKLLQVVEVASLYDNPIVSICASPILESISILIEV